MNTKKPYIFFGDKSSGIIPAQVKARPFFYPATRPVVLQHQVHGNKGQHIKGVSEASTSLTVDGDYLITQERGVGIGVLTADCLPIVFYDPKHEAVGIAHAGWQGTTKEIATKVVDHMHRAFGSERKDLLVFFGPSARPCCYEVSDDFIDQLPHKKIALRAVSKKGKQHFFDLSSYNQDLLGSVGISTAQINLSDNVCTICHESFCSYRRDNGSPIRQISIVGLY